MTTVLEQLGELKLVPVVKIENAADSAPLCDALVAAGLPCAEMTFRTAAAPEAIKTAADRGDMIVGAGTVLSVDQAKQAVDNGAEFIVSPGFNPKVVGYCVDNDIPVTPGVSNPTDVESALGFGLEVVKFFPAEAFGGVKTLKAISAPYGMMRFIPTGGINADNLLDYLRFEKVFACGGSWMVKSDLISSGKFDEITRLTAQAVALVGQL
ncbi:MAG: bifunctional 4-hydroxy-2-oxoglutarate aldolase/2-dehydro-3-deoxy-phosphogluconate aldolase [Planctomycetes bacterium]|nr:bifunctional 4-hydroxy-2-oxoglutarate aldolase/2-dehydro-3-deoxy-phosphogluconate aldolase [Planctomycetota bacterium]